MSKLFSFLVVVSSFQEVSSNAFPDECHETQAFRQSDLMIDFQQEEGISCHFSSEMSLILEAQCIMPLLFLLIAALGSQSPVVSLSPAGLNSFDVSISDFKSISGKFIGPFKILQASNSVVCNVSFSNSIYQPPEPILEVHHKSCGSTAIVVSAP